MRCIEIAAPGGPEQLTLVERPSPHPGVGEVCIAVRAAGVNRPDILQRYGKYPPPAGASDLPGLEVAGVVAAVGAGVTRWRAGDEVCALVSGGGYAELCVAPEGQCLPLPGGCTPHESAALPETAFTVWTNVFERGRLSPGEWMLVHGGTSGIGTMAIQLATARGARVVATAGSDAKCDACLTLGALAAWNYRTTDWGQAIREMTHGRGVDVVLDMVAGDYLPKNLSLLKLDGRCVVIAVQGGATATISAGFLMVNRLTLTGSTLRPQSVESKGRMARGLKEKVWPLLEAGSIKPIIYKTFPLRDAAGAHAELERADHVGKVMMTV